MNQWLTQRVYLGLLGLIILIAAALRFWHLGEASQLVFDEVYFSKFGHGYLTDTFYFDTHPPLSKYIIGFGIWLYHIMPWALDTAYQSVEIEALNPVSWRWMNAVTGTILVLVMARFSTWLHPSRLLSLLIALFIAIDGTFVVESRYGLNNIYLVSFGVCGLFFLAKAFETMKRREALALSGIFLGLSYSIKWNGLGFSLAAWMLIAIPFMTFLFVNYKRNAANKLLQGLSKKGRENQLAKLRYFETNPLPQANFYQKAAFWEYPVFLILLPLIVHIILWQPHLMMFDQYGFFEMQRQIFGYHSNSVQGTDHPYCSRWYSWPILLRPISYIFEAYKTAPNPADHTFLDVHLLGNPMIFWMSAAAMPVLAGVWIRNLLRWFKSGVVSDGLKFQSFVVLGFIANWFPWMLVSRCLFQYHYMGASIFAFMGLAWFIYKAFDAESGKIRALGIIAMILIAFGFIYWLPVQLGIELPIQSFYDRMWLRSWI